MIPVDIYPLVGLVRDGFTAVMPIAGRGINVVCVRCDIRSAYCAVGNIDDGDIEGDLDLCQTVSPYTLTGRPSIIPESLDKKLMKTHAVVIVF